jgi:hypothetical protein
VSISRGWASLGAWLLLVPGASLASCSPPTNCLRYSDCAEGLTCANSKCVPPPAPLPDASLEGGVTFVLDDAGGGTGGPASDATSVPGTDGSRRDATDDAEPGAGDAEAGGDARSEASEDATAE